MKLKKIYHTHIVETFRLFYECNGKEEQVLVEMTPDLNRFVVEHFQNLYSNNNSLKDYLINFSDFIKNNVDEILKLRDEFNLKSKKVDQSDIRNV